MARITYGAMIDSINGSIGGTTFQTNRYGFSVKRKPSPSKPNTPSQNSRKTAITIVQQNWIGLTAANRTAWNTYATTFPRPTRLNPDSNLNGFNFFSAYHLLRIQLQPTILADPSAVQQTLSFVQTDIVNAASVLTWDSDVTLSGAFWRALLYMSRVISPTTQLRRNRLRYIHGASVDDDVSLVVTTEYTDIFGSLPAVGEVVMVQEIWLHINNGQIFEGLLQRITVT